MKTVRRVVIAILALSVASSAAVTAAARRGEAHATARVTRPADPEPDAPSIVPTPEASPSIAPTPEMSPSAGLPETDVLGEGHDVASAAGKVIEVSIARQELVAWEEGVEIFAFPISTGRPGYDTPTGRFRIHTKYENRWSRKWHVWMPYAMFWHPKFGYALHELPYKHDPSKRIGSRKIGRPDSHGCVRLPLGQAKKLYEWAPVGTVVWIH